MSSEAQQEAAELVRESHQLEVEFNRIFDEEEGVEREGGEGENLPVPMPRIPDNANRMMLTREEQRQALTIKQAVEASVDLDSLNDFMYAQLALICKDNVQDAVNRTQALQDFRQEYGITDSYKGACNAVEGTVELLPNACVSFVYSHLDGNYFMIYDATKMDASVLTSVRRVNAWFSGAYYVATAFCPDLESIRKGALCLVECEGLDFTSKRDLKAVQAQCEQLWGVYPCTLSFLYYHTSTTFTIMLSVLKRLLPVDVQKRFQVGLTFDGRLDELWLVPNAAAGTDRMLQNMKEALKLRFQNEKTFSLTDESFIFEEV